MLIQAPTLGSFPSTNVTVGTSLADRAPPVAAMVGIVSFPRHKSVQERGFYFSACFNFIIIFCFVE